MWRSLNTGTRRFGRGPSWKSITADIRFALRQMRKAPAFTFTVVLLLGLGICGTCALCCETSCRRATGSLSRSLVKRCASCAPRETATYAMRLLSRSFAPSHWERLSFELRISRRREHCNSRNTYVQTSEQSWQRDSQSHR